jgi:2-polyprenyl-3-methyl-5-hydroxy-6-metoxy-1,4-benzoquinol methylase
LDLEALKQGSKMMWGLGDYRRIAEAIFPEAVALAEASGIDPGMSVLDVGAGTGNFAVAAAQMGASVIASDFAPQMIEWGKARTAAEDVEIEWREADTEDLPFESDRFDVVGSAFGAMFAPRPEVVAAELFRVAKPGGLLAMANWTSEGYSGRSAALIASFGPPAPADLPWPMRWGDPAEVERRLGGLASSVECAERAATFRFGSVRECRSFFRESTGGEVILRSMLRPERYAEFEEEAERLVRELARVDRHGITLENAYLQVVARKR